MNKLDELRDILNEYGHIFQNISELETNAYPCMDVSLDLINEPDFYAVDFTETQQVYTLFFTGSSDYFPGIWIGHDDINDIDSMPVYMFDLSSDCETVEPVGNVKQYITQIIDSILVCPDISDEDKRSANELKMKLEPFSNTMIDKGHYRVKLVEYFD